MVSMKGEAVSIVFRSFFIEGVAHLPKAQRFRWKAKRFPSVSARFPAKARRFCQNCGGFDERRGVSPRFSLGFQRRRGIFAEDAAVSWSIGAGVIKYCITTPSRVLPRSGI
jgi:hypothetical protein